MLRSKYLLCLLLLSIVNISFPERYPFSSSFLNEDDSVNQKSFYAWSEPTLIFQVEGAGEIHYPFVISDSYGAVHVFWTVASKDKSEIEKIYYTRLDSNGWMSPVDIIAERTVTGVSAAIGQDDYIYLAWNDGVGVSYSRAPIQEAELVKNWSLPVQIVRATNSYSSIVAGPSGKIYLAYPGSGTAGVFLQVLEPNKLDWSVPRLIAPSSLTNSGADYVKIAVSSNGTLHVVWTEFYAPENWPPRGVFYARSVDGGASWSTPMMLAGDSFDQANIAVVGDAIHVVWNGMVGVGGRYHRWSSDGGQTWSDTTDVVPPPLGGTEGAPQIVADQLGTVHMLTTFDKACPWYTFFESQRWAAPLCIKPVESKYIEEPALGISEGNKLHAVYWDGRKMLWYSTTKIDAAWIQPKVIQNKLNQSTQSPIPTDALSNTPTPSLSLTSLPLDQQLGKSLKFAANPGQLIVLSLSPVLLFIIFIMALNVFKKSR